jgi:type IX secretion system PorP/SprF family membrane protein
VDLLLSEDKMKKIIKTLFFLIIPIVVSGQLTPVTNQYVLNPLTINPAYAGGRDAMNIAAFYRRQWVGIAGAPETFTLAIDAPFLDSKLGLGIIIMSDKIGVTKETRFSSYYAYKISIGEGNLSFGLGAGLMSTNTAWSDLTVPDPGDEYFLIDSHVFVVPDFSFGVYYFYHNYFAGISIPKLLAYKYNFDKNKYSMRFDPNQYNYLFNTGYVINLSPSLRFFPSTLVSFSPGGRLLYDINAHFIISDRFWFGASYRNNRSVAGLLQFAINSQLRVAYTYDFDFGTLRQYSNGSHEVMIRYVFRYKVDVDNPLIF